MVLDADGNSFSWGRMICICGCGVGEQVGYLSYETYSPYPAQPNLFHMRVRIYREVDCDLGGE